ncbi:hypothetical protein CPB85DRAFT_210796 [Mucidula mucida]|nr:hypothetical protein CPB85DRAFT_210796 [Mucidula mucida]
MMLSWLYFSRQTSHGGALNDRLTLCWYRQCDLTHFSFVGSPKKIFDLRRQWYASTCLLWSSVRSGSRLQIQHLALRQLDKSGLSKSLMVLFKPMVWRYSIVVDECTYQDVKRSEVIHILIITRGLCFLRAEPCKSTTTSETSGYRGGCSTTCFERSDMQLVVLVYNLNVSRTIGASPAISTC